MKAPYRLLFNHELLILFTSQTPYQSYNDDVTDAQVTGCVEELRGTGVDALMICPQAWMTNLWHSEIDRRWQDQAPRETEPGPYTDWKYHQKAYFRARRYMLQGKDPVGLTVRAARDCGIAPFLSYRMNEAHYTPVEDCPTHSRFWREHPRFRLPGRRNLNYLEPEVRDHVRRLIFELLDRYDVDGFECDFMRHPQYFPDGRTAEGTEAMTGLLREIRAKLDARGTAQGKRLFLGVRVPRTPEEAAKIGLDVARWASEGLVDMVNASSFFRFSPEIDIEGYRRIAPETALYGEMHFVTQAGATSAGYANNINRRTGTDLYRAGALGLTDRGADGVSLFNFSYVRDHSFREPRRKGCPVAEPPFRVLPDLAEPERVRGGDLHLALTPGFDLLPAPLRDGVDQEFPLFVPAGGPFSSGILRIEGDRPIIDVPGLSVNWNGAALEEIPVQGELFPPLTIEALPSFLHVRHFRIDPAGTRPGVNMARLAIHAKGHNWGYWGSLNLTRIELGLYRGR